jgi:hypothetical protein
LKGNEVAVTVGHDARNPVGFPEDETHGVGDGFESGTARDRRGKLRLKPFAAGNDGLVPFAEPERDRGTGLYVP